MSKQIVLNLGNGNFYQGFPNVTVQIGLEDNSRLMEFRGSLPPATEIPPLHQQWQRLYSALYCCYRKNIRIEVFEQFELTNISETDFKFLCQQLSSKINHWLKSEQFRKIDQILRTHLNPNEEIRFIISTNDKLLRRLPWHLWSFFEDYPHAEVGLTSLEFQRPSRRYFKDNKVNILAIFGNSEGIDINKDKSFFAKLSNQAKIKFLIEPQIKTISHEIWEKRWNILFFAGHSYTQETGLLQINKTTTITLEQLKHGLQRAIENGLQLAIFNSCDGLGLAEALEDLNIPQVIVMREPVPDLVAQEFLKHFLKLFSRGKSLYSALHEARKRLEGIENQFPCATWLPIICHNPLEAPMTWKQRRKIITPKTVLTALLTTFLIISLVMVTRYFGHQQTTKLQAFDPLMQSRSQLFTKQLDPQFLIVNYEKHIEY